MNRIAIQQEFLPTDLVVDPTFWTYCIPIFMIILGTIFFVSSDSGIGVMGVLCSFAGTLILFLHLFGSDAPDLTQNYKNLKTNIQAVYEVDDVTLLNRDLHNGDTIKITNDGRTYEVIVNWDPETYKPTISPTTATVEDLDSIKR